MKVRVRRNNSSYYERRVLICTKLYLTGTVLIGTRMEVLIYCFYGRKNDILTIWQNREVIYLNQIYEVLGVCWNPENENECLKYDKNYIVQFQFEVFHESDSSLRIFILLSKNES